MERVPFLGVLWPLPPHKVACVEGEVEKALREEPINVGSDKRRER